MAQKFASGASAPKWWCLRHPCTVGTLYMGKTGGGKRRKQKYAYFWLGRRRQLSVRTETRPECLTGLVGNGPDQTAGPTSAGAERARSPYWAWPPVGSLGSSVLQSTLMYSAAHCCSKLHFCADTLQQCCSLNCSDLQHCCSTLQLLQFSAAVCCRMQECLHCDTAVADLQQKLHNCNLRCGDCRSFRRKRRKHPGGGMSWPPTWRPGHALSRFDQIRLNDLTR